MITRAGQSCKGALPLVSTGEANGNGIVAVVNSRAKQFTGETQGPRQEMTGADSWATKSELVLHLTLASSIGRSSTAQSSVFSTHYSQ